MKSHKTQRERHKAYESAREAYLGARDALMEAENRLRKAEKNAKEVGLNILEKERRKQEPMTFIGHSLGSCCVRQDSSIYGMLRVSNRIEIKCIIMLCLLSGYICIWLVSTAPQEVKFWEIRTGKFKVPNCDSSSYIYAKTLDGLVVKNCSRKFEALEANEFRQSSLVVTKDELVFQRNQVKEYSRFVASNENFAKELYLKYGYSGNFSWKTGDFVSEMYKFNFWDQAKDFFKRSNPLGPLKGIPPLLQKKHKTCAVVGSSAQLYLFEDGKHIDEHDLVIRMNCAIHSGFEKYVGSRTDVRFGNECWEGTWYDERDPDNHTIEIRHYMPQVAISMVKKKKVRPVYFWNKRYAAIACNVIIAEARKRGFTTSKCDDENWSCLCSTGYHAIISSLLICDSITVFGLTVGCGARNPSINMNEYYSPWVLNDLSRSRFDQQGTQFKDLIEASSYPIVFARTNVTNICSRMKMYSQGNRCIYRKMNDSKVYHVPKCGECHGSLCRL